MSVEDRSSLFAELEKLYLKRQSSSGKFVPGKDKVQYAGGIFGFEEAKNVLNAILDGWLGAGKYVRRFEKKFASFISVRKMLMVNSGSSANLVAFSSLASNSLGEKRLSFGDEVITPAATFPTTINPIIQLGLKPVLIDVNVSTLNPDLRSIKGALTQRTRAIMLPHTLGNPNEMDAIVDFCKEHDLFLIEDACDALGSRYDNRYVGTFGDFGTFSFYPAHHITTGEGGGVVTNNEELYNIALSIRDWGRACVNPACDPMRCGDSQCPKSLGYKGKMVCESLPEDYDKRYTFTNIGYNLKPIEVQGAMGEAQLDRLPQFIELRKKNFEYLYGELQSYERYFYLPASAPKADPAWFAFPLTLREESGLTRKKIVGHLIKANIEVKFMFSGNIVHQPAYRGVDMRIAEPLKNSDLIMRNTFFLGIYPGLTKEMLEYIVDTFKKSIKNM